MKKILILIFATCLTITAEAQYRFEKGNKQINAGLGISSWGIPIYAGFDYNILKTVSIGVEASYRSYKEEWELSQYSHHIIGILANGNYHLHKIINYPKSFDFYLGGNAGFYVWTSPGNYNGKKVSGFGLGGQVGGRYFFNDNVAINFEIGGGTAFNVGKLGITYKIF